MIDRNVVCFINACTRECCPHCCCYCCCFRLFVNFSKFFGICFITTDIDEWFAVVALTIVIVAVFIGIIDQMVNFIQLANIQLKGMFTIVTKFDYASQNCYFVLVLFFCFCVIQCIAIRIATIVIIIIVLVVGCEGIDIITIETSDIIEFTVYAFFYGMCYNVCQLLSIEYCDCSCLLLFL